MGTDSSGLTKGASRGTVEVEVIRAEGSGNWVRVF